MLPLARSIKVKNRYIVNEYKQSTTVRMSSEKFAKQPAFGRQIRFPYTDGLDDKEFEELLFTIFKQHHTNKLKPYQDQYDAVALMPGVGDDGQDVILIKGGQRVGLIQCKRLKTNLTKPQCAREIIKFALNAICQPALITDRDKFTYYLAAAADFAKPAIDLIGSFDQLIDQEPEFETWVNKVIRDYQPSFGHLTFKAVQLELRDILSKMKVATINATQLNGWLAQEQYYSIVRQFFPTIVLISQEAFKQIIPKLTDAQVIDRFYSASSDLLTSPATFEYANHFHLDRRETDELLTWIIDPLKTLDQDEQGATVAMLVGGAGYGKTTVLRDLLLKLHHQHIPVIGLKADRLTLHRRNDLEQELHLPGLLHELVEQLANAHSRVVVMVDQLDALSQSMSANREGLQTYNRLIEQLATLTNIRLIVSCRQYDLDYDPALVQYKQRHTVNLRPLCEAQVIDVLKQLGVVRVTLTPKLYDLLRIPLHLTLFCQVYRDDTDVASLATVQDLYHELWSKKILRVPANTLVTAAEVRAVIQQIANDMYERQQITIPYRKLESDHKTIIDYLISQSLITLTQPRIQFFHQSFFDYVFARSFVDRGLSITADLKGQHGETKHQGLFIRSKVRQVLAYLREVDGIEYRRELEILLTDPSYRFHLKLLTIQHLASQTQPTREEKRVLEQVIWPDTLLWRLFLESVGSPDWFRVITGRFANTYFSTNSDESFNQLYHLCRRVQAQCPDAVIQFLHQLPRTDQRSRFISRVLFILDDFSDPSTVALFEEASKSREQDDMWLFRVMERAMVFRPEWAGKLIEARLLTNIEQIEEEYNPPFPFERHSLELVDTLKKLGQQDSIVAFNTSLSILTAFIRKAKPYVWEQNDTVHVTDSAFNRYVADDRLHEVKYALLAQLETWLKELLDRDEAKSVEHILALLNSNYLTLISLGLQGVAFRPILLADLFYQKISGPHWLGRHDQLHHTYFAQSVLDALQACFPYLREDQQHSLIDQILALNIKEEYQVYPRDKLAVFRYTGHSQYALLNLLPLATVLRHPRTRKRYQELERKFGPYHPPIRSGRIMASFGRSMTALAYQRMNDKDWMNSFLRYDARKGYSWEGVDENAHAHRFTEEVKLRPDHFIGLIKQIIDRDDIPAGYVYHGLEGLQEANYDAATFKELFLKSVPRSQEEMYVSRLIGLTDYWVKREEYDSTGFDFLESLALSGSEHFDTGGDIDVYNRGINTIRGAALYRLYQWVQVEGYTGRCFRIMEQVAIDGTVVTRAVALYEQAQFNRYDKQRSLKLFLGLCTGHEVSLADIATHALGYTMHIDFTPLVPFFTKSFEAPKARHALAQLLMVGHANEYPGSDDLLERYIGADVDCVNGALDVALPGLTDKKDVRRERCQRIVFRFLDHPDEKVQQAYLDSFRSFEASDFVQLLPFLNIYVQSEAGRKRGQGFYAYLLKCVHQHASECIKLASFFDRHLGPDIVHRNLQNEPLDVVLQGYSTFEDYTGQSAEKEYAMDVFDRMLVDPAYRELMNGITDKLDG